MNCPEPSFARLQFWFSHGEKWLPSFSFNFQLHCLARNFHCYLKHDILWGIYMTVTYNFYIVLHVRNYFKWDAHNPQHYHLTYIFTYYKKRSFFLPNIFLACPLWHYQYDFWSWKILPVSNRAFLFINIGCHPSSR